MGEDGALSHHLLNPLAVDLRRRFDPVEMGFSEHLGDLRLSLHFDLVNLSVGLHFFRLHLSADGRNLVGCRGR